MSFDTIPFKEFKKITISEQERTEQDKSFYTQQEKLNSNKKIAGIAFPNYCSGNNLNIRDRFLELETIHNILQEQLSYLLIELDLTETNLNSIDLQLETQPLINASFNIKENINHILDNFNTISSERSFLPLIYPSYDEYSRFVKHFDYNIFFLEGNYLASNANLSKFEKFHFDKAELNKSIDILLGSHNPKDVISRLAEFIGFNPNKLALTYFNSRFGGFTVYINPENTVLNNKLKKLQEQYPESFDYFDNDPSWVFSFLNQDVIQSGITNDIDAWFDLDQCVLYIREECLPIDINLDVSVEHDFNLDYLKSIYFDYDPEARLIFRHDIVNNLRTLIPKENPKHLEIFNGEEFELFNSYRIWTFSEYILVRYKVGEDITKQAIFESKDLLGVITGYETDDLSLKLLKQISNNLKLLKISGFEKYNPYILINDPSTPFEDMI